MAELAPDFSPLAPSAVLLPVAKIEVGPRLRPIDDDWALALAASIEADGGLLQAIEVRRLPGGRYRLVFGGHRLRAHQLRGWAFIGAVIFDGTAEAARSREIAENVIRRDLSPLDRASNVAELYELERTRIGAADGGDNRAVGAKARWADAADTVAGAYRLQEHVAEKVGLSLRTVQRELQLHAGISPQARRLLADHPIRENAGQLRLLARQSNQTAIAEWLHAGEIASVAEGVARTTPKAPSDPSKKHFSAFLGAFARMGVREQRQALAALKLPAGMRLVTDGGAE